MNRLAKKFSNDHSSQTGKLYYQENSFNKKSDQSGIKPDIIKKDFPIFQEEANGNSLVYLDNAATTQKPSSVIKAVREYNEQNHGNPHRGAHRLSVNATALYNEARRKTKEFINAKKYKEIIFTRNTTESINLLAYSYGMNFIEEDDEIVLSIAEHHSNILPWQQVAKNKKASLKYIYTDSQGHITTEEIIGKITERTKLVSLTHMSNVLGTINPVKEIIDYAHQMGAVVLIDGAQSVPHLKVDLQDLDADFYVFSGHKMLGPMGIGVLYGKEMLLEEMPPFLTGGDMIEYVYEDRATFATLPEKFEAGTQNVEGAVGLSAAIDYLNQLGLNNIYKHEKELTSYALEKMKSIPYLTIYGPGDLEERGGIISFNINNVHPHDLASIVDLDGIALRAGHHCAQPLMNFLQIDASCRISFYLYNTEEDIDRFIDSLKKVRGWFGYGS